MNPLPLPVSITGFLLATSLVFGEQGTGGAIPASVGKPVLSTGPKVEFASSGFDFGQIHSGQVVHYDFVFTNSGTETLIIREVRPSCGCTTTGAWDKQVQPGSIGKIPVEFNSTGVGGVISKTIEVFSNDPSRPSVVLHVGGRVWRPIDVTPDYAVLNFGPDSPSSLTRVLKITNNLDSAVSISDPKASNPLFDLQLKAIREGWEYELHVTMTAPFNPTNVTSPITLRTTSSKIPTVTAAAFASVYPLVSLTPPLVTLPPGPLASTASFAVMIRNNSTNLLKLSNPAVPVLGATLNLQENQPGRVFTLRGTFPEGFTALGNRPVEISLNSNHPRFPVVKVQVVQQPSTNGPATRVNQPGAAGLTGGATARSSPQHSAQ